MGALNYCRGAELLLEAPKSPNNVTSTFFNTVNLPSKELRFDHWGAKLRPWGRRICFLPRAPSNLVTPLFLSLKSHYFLSIYVSLPVLYLRCCLKYGYEGIDKNDILGFNNIVKQNKISNLHISWIYLLYLFTYITSLLYAL